jgi:tRNA A-37 threonylcarbamoyl transferase component Bud32
MNNKQLRLFVDRTLHGRYRVVSELGQGGMGAVYEAIDLASNRHVAIKQTLPFDRNLREASISEASLLATLDYPQIPHLLDHFEEETGTFTVMQFVSGPTLGQLLASRQLPFTPNQVKLWAKDLLHIIAYLHNQTPAVIHQDIKPSNLKLLPDGGVFLLDFGLAKKVDGSDNELSDALIAYTPNYAPPEQIIGNETGPYSDIYALGATLYHLLTGGPPVDGLRRASHVRRSEVDPLEPINKIIRGVPHTLSRLITTALSLDPKDRPSATEMIEQLNTNRISPILGNAGAAIGNETDTVLRPKGAVLSRSHHIRIDVDIQPADLKGQPVVSFAAFREQKANAARRLTETASQIANIASVITILFIVGLLSSYGYRALRDLASADDRPDPYYAQYEYVSNSEMKIMKPSSLSYHFPVSLTLDEVLRWRAKTSKRDKRPSAPRNHQTSIRTGQIVATPATVIPF